MKRIISILVLMIGLGLQAQTALYNSGNIRIHDEGQIGFHTDLINNAAFDQNLGLAGFYGSNTISVSGAFMPAFFDTEIANDQGVLLNIGMSVSSNTNFVAGNFMTPRLQQDIYFNFLQDAFYVGEGDLSKVDGYVTLNNEQNFIFPVGDSEQLRSLTLNSSGTNSFAKCAYYFENPSNPATFPQSFDPTKKPRTMGDISEVEFWHLEGSVSSSIQISWNERSNMAALTEEVAKIIPVGWNIGGKSWVNLGAASVVGDLNQGFLISDNFVPDDYAIITFAAEATAKELLTLDNYLVTPNGDGVNDALYIEELELSNDDTISIYNRQGQKVYEEDNYTNGFTGFSNLDNLVINRAAGLPNGVYFYVIAMKDLKLNYQGFLYLEH
ncbi:gliding motility-associated C-terminal domain-containing protein [Arenibacter sp. M-2]|uniref:gliding motility-associated C-terminal domain-containing protein n=1 Tax=unclassified Arenibacter TaxID=2615047 RepID=UPI000D7575B3|nr:MULTISPECIES: gliding motility-associated C-terminal domain-containing protein [unclassified Arenibacter]MDL5510726.1 gliding motility-associated C-terminal domain-containing protein [Arenibacter sp. M-2]PXX26790.1 gliding motility-associated-like protein/predicted secreted protein (Por secretion system target) [Arenibacter sp. ARW7G5Y1]